MNWALRPVHPGPGLLSGQEVRFLASLRIASSGCLLDAGKRARTLLAAVAKSKMQCGLCLETVL